METISQIPQQITAALLQDAGERDLVTARRAALINLLWHERFLTRKTIIRRLENQLGTGCFGAKAWKDTFYRDMRFVKEAFSAAGYQLKFSRSVGSQGYYLAGEPALHPSLAEAISGALNELDPEQISIYKQLTPAQKFFQAVSIINFGRQAASRTKKI